MDTHIKIIHIYPFSHTRHTDTSIQMYTYVTNGFPQMVTQPWTNQGHGQLT